MLESKDILKFINGSSVNYQNTIFDELRKGILLSQDVDLTEFDSFLQNSVKKGSVLIVNVTSPSGNQFVQILRTNKSLTSTTLVAEDYINAINCTGNYEEILSKYNIEYLLISKNSALAKNIFNNSKYEKIFEDKISYVIKVKN